MTDEFHADGELVASRLGTLWLGLDTGGTYTDAVILAPPRRIVATAKALTTKHDLSIGLAAAIRAVVAELPAGHATRDITLVSVSTTLATNAVVEQQRNRICALLIGYDAGMLSRARLDEALAGNPIVMVKGGHHATGEEIVSLDLEAARAAILEHAPAVEAFAVSSLFSVRNPKHETRVRDLVRELTGKPVTCGHELTSRLDAPRRALTAALNAQLTPQLQRLLEAVRAVVDEVGIAAPLMVVKGDGSLMQAAVALECPVETILSGPAASVVGAAFMTGLDDFLVSDMGGTTTDIATVRGGRPVLRAEGAVVGGWNTMVQAVDVRTYGLGGDSEVAVDARSGIVLGPRRLVPISLLATSFPRVLDVLERQAWADRAPPRAGRFALRQAAMADDRLVLPNEQRVWAALAEGPVALTDLVRGRAEASALRGLLARGLVAEAGLTPSDAMHVLGLQGQWNRAAAKLGAALALREAKAMRDPPTEQETIDFCASVREAVIRATGRVLCASLLAQDPGIEPRDGSWGVLGDAVLADLIAGDPTHRALQFSVSITLPLVAIGGPVGGYYPEVARRLSTRLVIPPDAAVANAIGAVSGVVSHVADILVTQPKVGLFRVHTPTGIEDHRDAEAAIEAACALSHRLAEAAALRAGAERPTVSTVVERNLVEQSGGPPILVEVLARSTAIGRPAVAAIRPPEP